MTPNTWSVEPSEAHTPNGDSVGRVVFAELTIGSNSHTDRGNSAPVGRILCSTQQRSLIMTTGRKLALEESCSSLQAA